MNSVKNHLHSAARWLAMLVLVFHIVWVPVHLLTEAHHDSGLGHSHAEAHAAHHGHSHGDADPHEHDGNADHHHFSGDHESQFLSQRQALLFAPPLVVWQQTLLTPARAVTRELPVAANAAPPPADFPPPSGPRAPPLA